MIRIIVADDHELILEGVRAALAEVDDMEVVAEARDGSKVAQLVDQLQPDVVLLDIRLPKVDGLACLEVLQARHPNVKVIMLSAFDDEEHIQGALRRGAAGYIVKTINPLDLPSAVRQVVDRTVFHAITNGGGQGVHQSAEEAGLTDREVGILEGVARGLSNRALAKELWVTEQTVKFHLTNIYRKLGVANRTEAARAAYRLGIANSPLIDAGSKH